MESGSPKINTPSACELRNWLRVSLAALSLRPTTLARAVGCSVNYVSTFLRDETREITTTRAKRLEVYLRGEAAKQGVDLPDMIPGAHNES